MHGAGNDFLLVDGRGARRDWPSLAVAMCQRNTGAGADGLLVAVESAKPARAAVRMLLFNADGSEAEMSGNGVRCFAKFVVEEGIAVPAGDSLPVETGAGLIVVELMREGDRVAGARVDMGKPRLAPADIPVAVERAPPVLDLPVEAAGGTYAVSCVSMGNPHAVHFVDTPVAAFPLAAVGPAVERHPLFPARVNFEVARVVDRRHVESRTWERGVGETLACGTGACAIIVAARLKGLVNDDVEVREPGGALRLTWDGRGSVYLAGPAAYVYQGEWPEEGSEVMRWSS
jgi:diaminopimelate epimerase